MVHSSAHWLPERHFSVAATLAHADELIGQIGDLLFGYQTQSGDVIGFEEVIAGASSRTVINRIAPIPRKVPLLAGDAFLTLRAAMEHALFAEIEHEDGTLTERAAKLVELPACTSHDKFAGWLKKRARHGPSSLKVGSELVRRIESLQPYHRTVASQDHPLARLTLYANHAKHRTPAHTAVRLAAMYKDDEYPYSPDDLPVLPEVPLRIGDVIAETPVGTQSMVNLFPTVSINRPGSNRWPVLMNELAEIAEWVRTQALPRLITGTVPPGPSLPNRYEIAVGYSDERLAIAAGSMKSAAQRHSERLGAASTRRDLVTLLGAMENSPPRTAIYAWLEQLSDVAILDRMSELKRTPSDEPDVVRHNFGVLERMRKEALDFSQRRTGPTS